ncbi:MAG TPA: hypothetical protein VD902_18560, partial [Symbiobacteriaceae bacterium]|nr:hypothetical protein [Symbiobacteriaceae bacterium]
SRAVLQAAGATDAGMQAVAGEGAQVARRFTALAETAEALRQHMAQLEGLARGNSTTAGDLSATIAKVGAQATELRRMADSLLRR